jgi:predicted Zn-dependent peptidase
MIEQRSLSEKNAPVDKTVLANGLTIITEKMAHLRSVSVGIWVRSGSRHEAKDRNGISHFVEHALFKGTERRSYLDIAIEGDAIGGHLDAFTSRELACYNFKALDEHLPRAFDLLADLVTAPLFDDNELNRERKVVLEEINMVEDTPDDLVHEVFTAHFWPNHPLGRSILGTPETLATFDHKRMMEHFRQVYVPRNLVVAGAGNMEHSAFVDMVTQYMGELRDTSPNLEVTAPQVAKPRIIINKELEQAHLILGTPCPSILDEQRYPVNVLAVILGGGMSSRLFQSIREERGLAYSVFAGVNNYTDAGCLSMYAATSPEQMRDVIELSIAEFKKCKTELVPEEELQRAKDQLKVSIMLGLESSSARMSNIARQEILFGNYETPDEVLRRIDAVTAEAVQQVAQQIFNESGLAMSAIGQLDSFDAEAIELVC